MVLLSLHAHFPQKSVSGQLRVEHLQAVLVLEGQGYVAEESSRSTKKKVLQAAKYLRYLQKVKDILFGVRMSLNPLMEGHGIALQGLQSVCTQLAFQIKELELLSDDYDPSFGEATYHIVWDFIGRIRLLEKRLKNDPDEARKAWKKSVAKELEIVSETVQKNITIALDSI